MAYRKGYSAAIFLPLREERRRMLDIVLGQRPGNLGRFSRRDLLRVGALGVGGLTLPNLLQLQAAQAAGKQTRADACILVFLWGAPSQYETYDPKPEAPDGIRGEFGVTRTTLPGVVFGEH